MTAYYFLVSALPPLRLGVKPEISFKEMKDLLLLNLTPADLRKVELLLRPLDLYNIRALWLGMPLDEKGNFGAQELEETLVLGEAIPPYLADYLDRYESVQDRLRYFSSLYASLYGQESPELKGFLLEYYQLQREMRLVLTALRAAHFGRDIVRELQFEDPHDPLVASLLAQKGIADYTPPREYEDLKVLFVENISDPRKLNRAILQYQFDKIEEMEENHDCSIDRVLAYIARLILVESWESLDQEKGRIAVEQMSQYG